MAYDHWTSAGSIQRCPSPAYVVCEAHHGRPRHGDYLFFGESGIDVYCLQVSWGEYQITDRESGSLNVVPSFKQLIVEALETYLSGDRED